VKGDGMGRSFQIGVVTPMMQFGPERTTPRWSDIREVAVRAEQLGFDTVWTIDELLWRPADKPPAGFWEGVATAGAVAAVTSTVTVGTWVLSALHRNPALTAKAVETLDEISGGRFLFGLGAGHVDPGQAHSFGLPEDKVFGRFDEALQIIVPLLRGGRADFEGQFHAARDLPQIPVGPRPNGIPLMIGGNGPKAQRHAVRHADIWSGFVEERATVEEMGPKLARLDEICAEEGRAPESIERSVGVYVYPLAPAGERPNALSGTAQEIADGFRSFEDAGYTRLEVMFVPGTIEAFEALARVLERFDAARR
jgi:alkanesulfonate monooxygenase SsuD/methylene tetrahydromethanopterin reductase-like flavin-dependent oxidoreductase (luciferase family)